MDWPHQSSAHRDTMAALTVPGARVCVTSPTGSGKTRMMTNLMAEFLLAGKKVILYTNRRMLLEQTAGVLDREGFTFGFRAANRPANYDAQIQLAMLQSENIRVYSSKFHDLFPADLVIVDELHVNKGDSVRRILGDHSKLGAAIVGYTATPLDLNGIVDSLIVAAKMSDCFACGSVVPAETFGPDEPDLRHIRKYRVGQDLTEADNVKAIGCGRPGVFGRVFTHWQRLNPQRLPTILFAPDVAGSLWFAESFHAQGVSAAHIDGEKIWCNGKFYDATPEQRAALKVWCEDGEVQVVTNRFVLREGIDWTFLRHGILSTVFGSPTSYLQSVGRLLRAGPGKSSVIIQDHGGNYWRHGSVNRDREWKLDETAYEVAETFTEHQREAPDEQPFVCPKCFKVRLAGSVCPFCGYLGCDRSRMVVQIDGSLRSYKGLPIPKRKIRNKAGDEKLWERMYYRMSHANRTFKQAYGLFRHEHGHWPAKNLPLMPIFEDDWKRKVASVPRDHLHEGT